MVRNNLLVCVMYMVFAMAFLQQRCQSVEADTLPLGGSLAGKETLISKNGTFALGFFSPNGTNKWYVGIWFSQIPDKTVVWVANRKTPLVNAPGVLNFSRDGRLRLFDSTNGRPIWSSKNSLRASHAVMLENGNFIMLGAQNGSEIVWESFRYPGDTLLPGMKMWKGMKLTSWKNSSDPAPGPFSYGMDTSPGKTQFLMLSGSDEYWSTGEWIGGQFKNMPGYSGLEFVTLSPSRMYCLLIPSGTIMSRVVMAENGEIGRYFLGEKGGWTLNGFTPRDQCNVYNVCGAYAACNAYATSNGYGTSNACRCLEGFTPRDIRAWDSQQWWSSGCLRRRQLQCSASNATTDGFREVNNIYLADNQAVSFATTETLQGCRLACLRNCSCMAFVLTNSTIPICRLWFGDLLNVRDKSDGQSVFIRVAASELQDRAEIKRGRSHKSVMLRILLPATGALALALMLAGIVLRKRKKKAPMEEEENGVPTSLKVFTFRELRLATKNFKHKLGSGAFGSVFKGTLPDNTHVAVKRLERSAQAEKQFRAEICTIGNIQHVNLVMLRGFCAEGSKRLLVYEYMPNGSLNSLLFRSKEREGEKVLLDWKTRFGIALGTARGLVYLHQECRDRIIHCDIKPENILLDRDLSPKIADFGLAKLVGRDFSRVLTTTRGTRGYLAPEWISGLPITPKADVYSYGMTLLEIISGRRNVDLTVEKSSTYYFPPWAATQIHNGNLMGVVDDRISQEADGEEVRRAVMASMLCIQEDEDARPSMAQVVQLLEGVAQANAQQIHGSLATLRDRESEVEDSDTSV